MRHRTVAASVRSENSPIALRYARNSAGTVAMTNQGQVQPMIGSVVNELWRSFFGTTFGALRGALRRWRA